MHTPDPPFVRQIRVLLMLVHFVGLVVIFLPFTYSISPGEYILDMLHSPDEIADAIGNSLSEGFFWITLPLPFLAAIAIWLLQVRSFFNAAMGRFGLRLAQVAMWATMIVAAILHLSFAIQMASNSVRGSGPDSVTAWSILGLGFLGVTGLIAIVWINHHRRLHRMVVVHAGLRFAYIFGVGMPLLGFGLTEDLQLGAWLSFALCGVYAIEAIVLFIYGKAHSSGSASSTVLRYWLPTPDADPRSDLPICAKCGYDLRGTIPAGGRVCPECGAAIVAL